MKEFITLNEKQIKTKNTNRKIFEDVFDTRTINALKKLNKQELFSKVEALISTGKEANVFKAKKNQENCAIKIYKIETSSFYNMKKYITGDIRFNVVKKQKQNIIFEWTKKEFRNLSTAFKHKVIVPFPIGFYKNVLVLEYLGTNTAPAVTLKNDLHTLKNNIDDVFFQIIKNMHNLLENANLIHADLSEYNMIYFKNKLYFFDMGQSVLKSHPYAKEFYERDITNLTNFLNKYDYNLTNEKLKKMIKEGE